MPKAYVEMRNQFQKKQGLSKDQAQSKASAIYVSQGKNAKARRQRAKALKEK